MDPQRDRLHDRARLPYRDHVISTGVTVCGSVERSLGLATVRMHTAAAASDARIPGLDKADAAKLRDQLASLGESQAAGL